MRSEELEKMYLQEDAYWWFVGRRRLVRALVRRYGAPDPKILDVGCGTGGTLDILRDCGTTCGADISADALRFCCRRDHRRLAQANATHLPYGDASFDVAVCCDVFEHLPDDSPAVAEVLRVLTPGGVMIVSVPAYAWLWSEHDEALSHYRRYEKAQLRSLLQVPGAHLVKLTNAVSFVFPLVAAVRLLGHLRRRKSAEPRSQAKPLHPWINRLLVWLMDLEVLIVTRAGFPFGCSLIAVVRKADSP